LVQNFDVTISEVYRVLKTGCPFAFTVWGNQPDSKFFTIIEDTLGAMGEIKEGPKDGVKRKSLFHSNDRELVIPAMEKVGFKNCRSLEAYTPMFFNEWENGEQVTKAMFSMMAGIKGPLLSKVWKNVKKFRNENKKPLGFSLMFYYGYK
jgi:hypothetical protein